MPGRPLVEVDFGERQVLLCLGHEKIAKKASISSFEALRDFYRESYGNRSYVERRARRAPQVMSDRRQGGRRFRDLHR